MAFWHFWHASYKDLIMTSFLIMPDIYCQSYLSTTFVEQDHLFLFQSIIFLSHRGCCLTIIVSIPILYMPFWHSRLFSLLLQGKYAVFKFHEERWDIFMDHTRYNSCKWFLRSGMVIWQHRRVCWHFSTVIRYWWGERQLSWIKLSRNLLLYRYILFMLFQQCRNKISTKLTCVSKGTNESDDSFFFYVCFC